MPRIFDNIRLPLKPALDDSLREARAADFCVGYFNLRGWRQIDSAIHTWPGGPGHCCRLLVGMHRTESDEVRRLYGLAKTQSEPDNATALRLREELAREFREQLCIGVPRKDDQEGLSRLAEQLREKRVQVKLFLKHPLHAKLYLVHKKLGVDNPRTGFVGSSNLTFSGLSGQGELNVDVLDQTSTEQLASWFNEQWNRSERECPDISAALLQVLEDSWARPRDPYLIYLKMAFHLSQEARAGVAGFQISKDFSILLPYQVSAVKIAANHLNRRGGVVIGDVVGLGKTLMATALARVFEDDFGLETLILCPPNLVKMWEKYAADYRMRAQVLSTGSVVTELPTAPRRRLLIIDESHNLRSREGKKYAAIKEYIERNDCKVILLTATPYNKSFLDLSAQLRLFLPEDAELGARPERLLREMGEDGFARTYQCPQRSILAFEKSPHPDDWRELMRLYMVRRTRSFIREHYAKLDNSNNRRYLELADGERSYFPDRRPRTVKFASAPGDQFARLYSDGVVDTINALSLPRYGLGGYTSSTVKKTKAARQAIPDSQVLAPAALSGGDEARVIENLGRAGARLKGFCRTNLFKRLESSGHAFLQSLERHILRNFVFSFALQNGLPLPIGTQSVELFETTDLDTDATIFDDGDAQEDADVEATSATDTTSTCSKNWDEDDLRKRAREIYIAYAQRHAKKFAWLRAEAFVPQLRTVLEGDAKSLLGILKESGAWDSQQDAKLQALHDLVSQAHAGEKVLVFSQFADTIKYLHEQLDARDVKNLVSVTGGSAHATEAAWKFSPISNNQTPAKDETRVLLATDVLSEGQNLQDAHIVVSYDLPWAIIRLIQRAGRVDRIGQKASEILCYSFLPAEGVEKIINLRGRLEQRLYENAEVVGSDDNFFEDGAPASTCNGVSNASMQTVRDLYSEKSGVLDGESEGEVDLASYAFQIWKNAIDARPDLASKVEAMPDVVFGAKDLGEVRPHAQDVMAPRRGALLYARTAHNNDALAWVDEEGRTVTESQYAILRAAECAADLAGREPAENHLDLVARALEAVAQSESVEGASLGAPRSIKRRAYDRLKALAERESQRSQMALPVAGAFSNEEVQLLKLVLDDLLRHPLRESARDSLSRQMRAGADDETLARLALSLREDGRLCVAEQDGSGEARILCSMGIV